MKSIQRKKDTWKKINKVILRVDSIDLSYEKNTIILFDCGFENISKGRCKLTIKEKEKTSKDNLFIHNDKALMEVNVHYNISDLDKLLKFFSYKRNLIRKIKISLTISDSLMVNYIGDLYVKDKTDIRIESIGWDIPIL